VPSQRQGHDTIISWLDREVGTDLAISFQESVGCNYIWEQIHEVQTQYLADKDDGKGVGAGAAGAVGAGGKGGGGGGGSGGLGGGGAHASRGAPGGGSSGDEESGRDAVVEFPTPDISTLPEIVRLVTEISSPHAHEKVRVRVCTAWLGMGGRVAHERAAWRSSTRHQNRVR
jgi:hypothetical protein